MPLVRLDQRIMALERSSASSLHKRTSLLLALCMSTPVFARDDGKACLVTV